MKTNTIKAISITLVTALFAGIGSMEVSDSMITGAAVTISYLAVAALVAMASADYRTSSRAYFA